MNTKDHELVEIDGCKINTGQATVVRKADSAIHWININLPNLGVAIFVRYD